MPFQCFRKNNSRFFKGLLTEIQESKIYFIPLHCSFHPRRARVICNTSMDPMFKSFGFDNHFVPPNSDISPAPSPFLRAVPRRRLHPVLTEPSTCSSHFCYPAHLLYPQIKHVFFTKTNKPARSSRTYSRVCHFKLKAAGWPCNILYVEPVQSLTLESTYHVPNHHLPKKLASHVWCSWSTAAKFTSTYVPCTTEASIFTIASCGFLKGGDLRWYPSGVCLPS